jgi:hypothetical protein
MFWSRKRTQCRAAQVFKPLYPTFAIQDKHERTTARKKLLEAPDGALHKSIAAAEKLVADNVASGGGVYYYGDEPSVCDLGIFKFVSSMGSGCVPGF